MGLTADSPAATSDLDAPRPSRHRRNLQHVVWAIAATAAIAGALVPDAGDGAWASPLIGAFFYGATAGVVTLACSRARRWTSTWLAGVALIGGDGWWLLPAGAGFVAGLVSTRSPERNRVTSAAVGALGMQTLLRLPDIAFTGVPTVLVVIAVLPALVSGYGNAHGRVRRHVRRSVAIVVAVAFLALVALGGSALFAVSDLDRGVTEARRGLDALRDGDQRDAAVHFDNSSQAFARAEDLLDGPWTYPARLLPGVATNHHAALEVASSGAVVAASASTTATVAPYQDLKAEAGRVDLAVVAQMQPAVADSVVVLTDAEATTSTASSPWLVPPLADALDDYTEQLVEARSEAELADAGLRLAPALLGGDEARTYLVLFTSPAETRLMGGFVGSYGILEADDGQVELTTSGSISDWGMGPGEPERTIEGNEFDEWRTRYSRFNPGRFFQNLTAGPDFPTNAAVTAQLFPQASGFDIDGVMAIDPYGLAALLELTGPVEVEEFGTMDAANAVDYLLRDQYIVFEDESEERRELLIDASRATFEALTTRDLPGPRAVGDALGPVVAQDRLSFWATRDDERSFLDDLGLSGAFTPVTDGSADFFSLRGSNQNPNKIDIFLERHIDYDVSYDRGTGELTVDVAVTLTNGAPPDGLPDYVIGNRRDEPRGSNSMYLSLYTPHLLEKATVDGEPLPLETQTELGARVYSAQVAVPAGGSTVLRYRLLGNLLAEDEYTLDLSSQPIVTDDTMTVTVASARSGDRVATADGLEARGDQAEGELVLDVDQSVTATLRGR